MKIVDKWLKNYKAIQKEIYLIVFIIFLKFWMKIFIFLVLFYLCYLRTSDFIEIKNILYIRMVYLYQLDNWKKDIVLKVCFKVIGKF